MKCTTTDGNEIRINLDHVVTIGPTKETGAGKGSEITFVGGSPRSLVVRQDQYRQFSAEIHDRLACCGTPPKLRGGHPVSERLCS
jgi:hypothetical protein